MAEAELRGRVDGDPRDVSVVVDQVTHVQTGEVRVQGRKLVKLGVSMSFRFST